MLLLCALLIAHVSLAGHVPATSHGPTPLVVDCPGLGLNFGDPCDDGDPCTIGTTVDGSCQCSGGTPACDDSDPCTTDLCIVPGACTAPDNGSGSADLPAASCPYACAPGEAMQIISGLPVGTTIDIPSTIQNLVCSPSSVCSFSSPTCMQPQGLGYSSCRSGMVLMPMTGTGSLAGFNRNIPVPIDVEIVQLSLTSGPVQQGPADLSRLFGELPPGDPDFDLLRITGGTDFGLPSPGHTTLVQLPGGDWAVDSFFDITYRIDFVGAAGGPLAGMSGSTTGTVRMQTPPGSGPSICVHLPMPDSDGDGLCDAVDQCPATPGQLGDPCDDGNPMTSNDVIDANCQCHGTIINPCTTDLTLVFQTDGATNIGWEIHEQGTDALVQSGGGVYPISPGYNVATCVPDGCYYLVVTSDLGGIVQNSVQGGYTLSTLSGDRLIDNRNNFLSGATSQIAGGDGFCFPMATVPRIIYTSCDKMDWNVGACDGSGPSPYRSEFIVADIDAAVSGDYPNALSGYTFWFYNPNGGYNFRRFRSHAQGEGAPVADSDRYTHCLLNNWAAANALQQNTLYNVRVRAVLNGNPGEFGPACRMKLDQAAAQCPVTKLMDVPGHPQLSCSQFFDWSTGNYVYARPVWRYNNNCVKVNANRYRFRFYQPAEPYDVTLVSSTYYRQLNWNIGAGDPLDAGENYWVTVEASFNNGASYCPVGDSCLITMNQPFQGGGNQNMVLDNSTGLRMYPNPNRGDQLYLGLDAIEEGVQTVSVDIYDLFGKRVSARTIAVQDGFINTVLELNGELAAGMYMVNITAGDATYTERLVIQP